MDTTPVTTSPTVRIPLRHRKTKKQQAYALVDASDLHLLKGYTWKLVAGGRYAGAAVTDHDGRTSIIYLHRHLMGCTRGDGTEVDHRNGNKLDNRRSNLRLASPGQNRSNLQGPKSHNSSGYRNVYWDSQRGGWKVKVRNEGRCFYGGFFTDAELAATRAAQLREELFGVFAGKG